jgi:hypothetical protein
MRDHQPVLVHMVPSMLGVGRLSAHHLHTDFVIGRDDNGDVTACIDVTPASPVPVIRAALVTERCTHFCFVFIRANPTASSFD